jgi:hypothetical protein
LKTSSFQYIEGGGMMISAEAVEQYTTANFVKKFNLEIHNDKALLEWSSHGNKNIATVNIVKII